MVPFSSLIKDILIDAEVGTANDDEDSADWRIHLGKQVDNPARVISLYDSGGMAANPRWLLNYPNVVAQVRGGSYSEAYEKIDAIRSVLVGIEPQDISDVGRIDGMIQIGDIAFVGFDTKDRPQFSATFRAYFEPVDDDLTNREAL